MDASIAYSIGEGLALGTNTALLKRAEDSVRAGRAPFAIGLFQAAQVGLATSHVMPALEAARVAEIPTTAGTIALRCVLAAIPFFLAFAIHNVIENDTARCICIFVQNHIGNLCQVVSIVSAVALIAFGNIAMGAASLTFMALGALDRYGLFPENVSYLFRKATIPIMILSSLLTGGAVEKIFAMIHLAAMGCEEYYKHENQDKIRAFENREALLKQQQQAFIQAHPELLPQEASNTTVSHSGLLTPRILQKILANEVSLRVNPLHVRVPINVSAKETTKLETLLEFFDAIELDPRNESDLRAKLLQDDRFRQSKGVSSVEDLRKKGISKLDLHTYAREQLEQFIRQVKARHVEAGAIHDYDRLENYLKVIIEQLPRESSNDRASYMVTLAVEGGQYCGPGRFHATEEVWSKLVWKTKEMPLGTKVLFHLQDVRTETLRAWYAEFVAGPMLEDRCMRFFNHIINVTDLHTYNQIVNLYAEDFGIRKGAADNDELAVVQPLQRIAIQTIISQFRDIFFQTFYNADFIIEKLHEKSGTPPLPKDQINTWWQHWMTKQDDRYKTQLMDTFLGVQEDENEEDENEEVSTTGTLYGHELTQTTLKTNPIFIKAMLFDMGILELDTPQEEDSVELDSDLAI